MKYFITSQESFQKGDIPEDVKKFLKKYPNPFIILDESSKIKSNRAMYTHKMSKRAQGILKLNTVGHRCILTGTFMSKSPVNAYNQMCFLCENYFKMSIWDFQRLHCVTMVIQQGRGVTTLISEKVYKTVYNGLVKAKNRGEDVLLCAHEAISSRWGISLSSQLHILAHPEYTPFKNVDSLLEKIKDDVMFVKKEDVLDIPPKQYSTIRVEPTPEMKSLYDQLLKKGFIDNVAVDGIALYHRFQDICNGYIPKIDDDDEEEQVYLVPQKTNPKLDTLEEKIDEIDTKKSPVIVWSNRKKILQDAYTRLKEKGYVCALYDGDTSKEKKEKIKKAFIAGKIDVFLGNTRSGGFGLDYLKKADYAFYVCNDESVETRVQSEDRIHRGGITSHKFIYDIVIAKSVDEKVMKNLRVGIELIKEGHTDKEVFEWVS